MHHHKITQQDTSLGQLQIWIMMLYRLVGAPHQDDSSPTKESLQFPLVHQV
jgi:hypothetical protein